LSLFVEDVANAEFSDQLRLSREMKAALRKLRDAKKRAVREELRARTTAQDVARLLTQKLNLSVRDAGEILNLSHQRIEQLVHDR
jgi:hypothetical protein